MPLLMVKSEVVRKIGVLLICLICVGVFGKGNAQIFMTGVITDQTTDNRLPGVHVKLIGTDKNTWSDHEGKYAIMVDSMAMKIAFYRIGYQKQIHSPQEGYSLNVALVENDNPKINLSFATYENHDLVSPVITIQEEEFNKGIISDPLLLIQGRVPGMQIYNRGGNPNEQAFARIRGINSLYSDLSPLYIIDGIMGASISNVDPNDIESIQIIKDGMTAFYGMRGSNGVVIINTKSADTPGKNKLVYSGNFGVSTLVKSIDVMDASEFVNNQGLNLGSSTNWMDQITRQGLLQVHHLSSSGGNDHTSYRISGNLRNTEGILKGTGFDQYNFRLKLDTKGFKDRLKVNLITSYTDRNQKLGFPEAFEYGITYNPTAPIFGVDSPYEFNSDLYGGFFESVGLFNAFNPLALVSLNQNDNQQQEWLLGINTTYEISNNLNINFRTARQSIISKNYQYYPTTSIYGGYAVSPFRKGLASIRNDNFDFQLYEAYGSYQLKGHSNSLQITGGYSFQEYNSNNYSYSLGGFPSDDIDFINNIESSSDLIKAGFIRANSNAVQDDRIISFFGNMNTTFWNTVTLNASYRKEGSSRLGKNNKWGTFYSTGLGLDLTQFLSTSPFQLLKLRMNYGVSGNIPFRPGVSQAIWSFRYEDDGGFYTRWPLWENNFRLGAERNTEFNIGVEIATKRFLGSLDVYQRKITDLIVDNDRVDGPSFIMRMWQNNGALSNWGMDINLNFNVYQSSTSSFNTGIVWSTNRTTMDEFYSIFGQVRGNLGGPGGNLPFSRIAQGEHIGDIYGAVFNGTNESGDPLFEDLNNDGVIVLDIWNLDDNTVDAEVLGSGLPDFELGWIADLKFGDWRINSMFRGAFGHSLVNSFRYSYEPRYFINRLDTYRNAYNYVDTNLAEEGVAYPRFSSLYVENASFIKWDNLSISKKLNLSNQGYISNLEISLTAQNLLTISGYTGADPEPTLYGRLFIPQGEEPIIYPDVLSPGIDRRDGYLPSRTISLGISFTFD